MKSTFSTNFDERSEKRHSIKKNSSQFLEVKKSHIIIKKKRCVGGILSTKYLIRE